MCLFVIDFENEMRKRYWFVGPKSLSLEVIDRDIDIWGRDFYQSCQGTMLESDITEVTFYSKGNILG